MGRIETWFGELVTKGWHTIETWYGELIGRGWQSIETWYGKLTSRFNILPYILLALVIIGTIVFTAYKVRK